MAGHSAVIAHLVLGIEGVDLIVGAAEMEDAAMEMLLVVDVSLQCRQLLQCTREVYCSLSWVVRY